MKIRLLFLSFIALLVMNSCYVNRTTVGDGPVNKHGGVRFAKAKQFYLFWGGIAVGKAQPSTPQNCGYQIKSCFNFWDLLINTFTGGLIGTRTVKVLVVRDSPCDPHIEKLKNKLGKEQLKQEIRRAKE